MVYHTRDNGTRGDTNVSSSRSRLSIDAGETARHLTGQAGSPDGAGPRYLWRVQSGEIEKPAAATLLAIAQHVRAELRELQATLLDGDADVGSGRALALASAIRRGLVTHEDARILENASREELRAAIEYLSGFVDRE